MIYGQFNHSDILLHGGLEKWTKEQKDLLMTRLHEYLLPTPRIYNQNTAGEITVYSGVNGNGKPYFMVAIQSHESYRRMEMARRAIADDIEAAIEECSGESCSWWNSLSNY